MRIGGGLSGCLEGIGPSVRRRQRGTSNTVAINQSDKLGPQLLSPTNLIICI